MTLREDHAKALRKHFLALQDNYDRALPQYLDELDALHKQYAQEGDHPAPATATRRTTARRKG